MTHQLPLLSGPPAAVPGLRYLPDFLDEREEGDLIRILDELPFRDVVMRGVTARRKVLHFGFDYDYAAWSVEETAPPPPWLLSLRDRAAAVAGVAPEAFEQFLVGRYPPGATIGWHRDAPMFGSPVLGISLAASCRMRFRRKYGDRTEAAVQSLEPRSLYILDGESRRLWQHSIPPVGEQRYSITMRTMVKTTARKVQTR